MSARRLLLGLLSGLLGLVLLVPIALLLAPCVFVAWITRMGAALLEPAHQSWQSLIEFDGFAGWKVRAGLHTHHLADDVYHTTTDADGWRGSASVDESDMLVFGDSYVFGHAIDDRQHFAHVNPRLRIKAIGVNGYNMVQTLLWMKKLAPKLQGKLVLWCVYLGNDLTDNMEASMEGYRIPFVTENGAAGGWRIVTSHLKSSPWPSGARHYLDTFSERMARIFLPGASSDRIFSACGFLVAEAAETVCEAGGTLIVMSIPNKVMLSKPPYRDIAQYVPDGARVDIDYPDRQLADICARLHVPFVAGKDTVDLRHYRQHDTHWNAAGHARIAELLATLIGRYGAEPSASTVPLTRAPASTPGLRAMESPIDRA